MIYLNNAATSYPKPPSIVEAVAEALRSAPRSALRSSMGGDDTLSLLRQRLGTLFHIADHDRIFFASGATDALNRLVGGVENPILATTDNHNSVLRPISNGQGQRSVDVMPYSRVLQQLADDHGALQGTILIIPHGTNVTGHIHDMASLCHSAHEHGMLVCADVAQSAGCIPIDVDGWGIDMLAFTGHKALFGPQGTGGYYVRRGIDLRPTVFGGTGRDSTVVTYANDDWEYEVGTQNIPGLAGLKAGVDEVLQQGVEAIFAKGNAQANRLIQALRAIPHVTVYSEGGEWQGPVVSFNISGLLPSDVGYMLQNSYGITVRTGLHCAPYIHKELLTYPHGTVRASLSCHTTDADLQVLVDAIGEISASIVR
ncbi:MAG: aminotransferase class V-fold PLP-dependent enzyme [Prevotella sp.]|nr:aminotransferase class V-fold PLP-dependent enzyme [Prevotella sp.]